jgi:hypothetical protein
MAEPIDDEEQMDISDDLFMFKDCDDIPFDLELLLAGSIEKDLVLSGDIQSIFNLIETVSHDQGCQVITTVNANKSDKLEDDVDCGTSPGIPAQDIPTHPNEWLVTDRISRRLRPPRLYEFLYLLLQKPSYASYASYKDKSQGIFRVHEPEKIAELWQQIKSRQSNQKMTYDNFARAIRWYYKNDIMKKTNTRYTFQFSSRTLQEFIDDENNNVGVGYSNVNQKLIGILGT